MKNIIKNLNKEMKFSEGGVFSKVLAKTEKSNHTLFCLSKGTDMSEHTSTKEGSVTVIKGKGEFVLNGEKIRLEPGVFIFMPANAPHSLRADEDLTLLLSLLG